MFQRLILVANVYTLTAVIHSASVGLAVRSIPRCLLAARANIG